MPISFEEFDRGARVTPGDRTYTPKEGKAKATPTMATTRKTVQFKGPIKEYGQYHQKKFFVKFSSEEGEDDKGMFHETHWKTFQSGDIIEFESRYNPETGWHGVHKRHYVVVVEHLAGSEIEVELDVDVGYVTRWKEGEETGELTCKTYLKEFAEGVKTIIFDEGTIFNDVDFDYARCKIFGKRENGTLRAETVEVVEKRYMPGYHIELSLKDVTYYDGSISFTQGDFKGSLDVEWSSTMLNKEKGDVFGFIQIYGDFRMHGRWIKDDYGEWAEKTWYVLDPERCKFSIQDEYLDFIKEIVIGSKVVEFIKGIKRQTAEEHLSFGQIIALAKSEGIELNVGDVVSAFWKSEYDMSYWEYLADKKPDEVYIHKDTFVFAYSEYQIFEVPKIGTATYIFKADPSMDLKKKVWLYHNSRKFDIQNNVDGLGDKMGYFGRVTHDYLDLWKMKLERVI